MRTWRIAKAWIWDFWANSFAIDAEKGEEALSDMDDISSKPYRAIGIHWLLHSVHYSTAGFICPCDPGARPSPRLACQYYRASTAVWTAQQTVDAFPEDSAPRYLLRDRDGVYGHHFTARVEGMGIEQIRISPRSPWQNCYVERLIGIIRRDCLNHVIVINAKHLRRILKGYFRYYHEARTHLALDKDAPVSRPIQLNGGERIVAIPQVGGLHHQYERRVA
jgi:Integrase core domain